MARASLRGLPLGLYGMVMGVTGLGLAWRAAGAPAWASEPWIALGAALFALLALFHLAKLLRHADAVRAELANAALLGFCATLPVSLSLVAAGLAPHAAGRAAALWWIAYGLHLAFMAGGLARWLFAASVALAPILMGLSAWRAWSPPPLPAAASPTWFVLLAPPMLLYINGPDVWGPGAWLDAAYFGGLLLALGLLVYARRFWRWPFSPGWWSFTFPLDAVAVASLRYAQAHPAPLWRGLAWAALALATGAVLLVGARTLAALRAGAYFPPPMPRSGASPRA